MFYFFMIYIESEQSKEDNREHLIELCSDLTERHKADDLDAYLLYMYIQKPLTLFFAVFFFKCGAIWFHFELEVIIPLSAVSFYVILSATEFIYIYTHYTGIFTRYGVVLKRSGYSEDAQSVFLKAIALVPCLWSAWYELSTMIDDRNEVSLAY